MSKSREQLNEFLKRIDIEGKTVLDVGVQDKPTSRLTTGTPRRYYTLDIDPQWPATFFGDLNDPHFIRDIDDQARILSVNPNDMLIDTIFCIEVLEHCWNPVQVIKNLHDAIRPGGMVYISTPFINPHHDVVDYLRYTDEWYRDVLPKFGFHVVEIQERRATFGLVQLKNFYAIEGMKYSKIRQKNGPYTYPVGYFVTAKRID